MFRFCAIAVFAIGLIPGASPASTPPSPTPISVWRLDCGSFTAPRDDFSDLLAHAGERRRYVDSCYIIRHGKDVLLWDAGLPLALLGQPEDRSTQVHMLLTVTITNQMARIGIRPEDVTLLGISHMHSDHTGQAAAFPHARLLMDQTDFDALRHAPTPFFTDAAPLKPWLLDGAPTDLVSGDRDVFGDGSVIMIALPGHTAGNHGLFVRLPHTGPILLSGDALHEPGQLISRAMPPSNISRADSLASLDRIIGIVRETHATLIIQHDPASVAKLPAFPKSAD